MKKRFLIIATLIALLASCPSPSDKQPNNKPENPDQKTFIVFDNTQGICTVSVYDDYRRRDGDKIAELPAGRLSSEIKWMPSDSVPFYFSYRITIKGINDFSLNYVPEPGRDQKQVRIDADVTTNIKIPTLSETFSSPDKLLSDNSYLIIQNNSSYSFRLLCGDSPITPDDASASLVNNGERVKYTINPGAASSYQLMVGADYKKFPGSIVKFEAGHIYYFEFNGSVSLVWDIELKLINVNGIAIPQPPAAPEVIVSNGSLALRWAAVESATAYEIWMSTVNDSASATQYGTDITASLSASINGLNNGTTYYIWLNAKNILGTSDNFSPVAKGTPSASTVKPPDPQTAPSIIAGNGQLSVSWQAVEDASFYEVLAGTTNNPQNATKRVEDVTGLSTVISDLNNGTTYYVWIKAGNNIDFSDPSPPATGKPLGTPGTPTVSSGFEQLLVTWTAVAGAEQYEVYYGIDSPTTLVATTAETTTNITGLTNGTAYYVRLRAKNVNGVSDYGPSASGVPIGNIGVITVSSGDGQLSISWSAVAGADQYEVYYNTTDSIPSNSTQTVSTITATINGLTNGTIYYVWVKGKNTNGTSNTSVVVSGKPLGTPGMPIITPGYGQLLVTWTAVAGADEYEVYYGIDTPTTLATTTTETTATITGLTSGTTYYVRLRAKNTNGVSNYGLTASGAPNKNLNAGLYRGTQKIGNQNLAASLTYISSNAVNGDDFYIVLGADESLSPKTLNYSGKTVGITLLGYGSEKTITLSSNGSLFTINSGVTLTLDEDITLVGRSTNNAALVYVSGGNLIMYDGTKISGNSYSGNINDTPYGGGVRVDTKSIFTMSGGEISDNRALIWSTSGGGSGTGYGGGVYNAGTFIMSGGKIKDNTAGSGGLNLSCYGGGVWNAGTFTMSGGEISGNSAVNGGGVYNSSTFTMNNGEISGNNASSQYGELYSGISGSGGGGVYNSGTFNMNDGKISINIASSSYIRDNNTPPLNGGGVWNNGTFTMSGGKITGNTASISSGGGVKDAKSYGGGVSVSSGTFIMKGGEITGNTTSSVNNYGYPIVTPIVNSYGGGVNVYGGSFTKSGGIITGYISDMVSGNVVKENNAVQNNRGHAVYAGSKCRETTAGSGINLDSSKTGAAGGWEN